jgi:hypothetical protein
MSSVYYTGDHRRPRYRFRNRDRYRMLMFIWNPSIAIPIAIATKISTFEPQALPAILSQPMVGKQILDAAACADLIRRSERAVTTNSLGISSA